MRSLRPLVIYPSYKAAEYQSDMMRMKQNDDSLGRDTTLCGDPSFLSLMKGTLFFNEYNMDVEVTPSIFPQPSSFFPQPSSLFHHIDCEDLVKILVARCKKLDAKMGGKEK